MKTRLLTTTVVLTAILVGALAQPPKDAGADPVSTYTVNSNGDGIDAQHGDGQCDDGAGACTLRAAIEEANATPELDEIQFNITVSIPNPPAFCPVAPEVICPTRTYDIIGYPVIINGTTQPGYAEGTPVVEINGLAVGPGADGLIIAAGSSTVRAVWIHGFSDNAIDIRTNGGNVLEGNWIGNLDAHSPDPDTGRLRNGGDGIFINNTAGNVIGGTTLAQRNVISGNGYVGATDTDAYGIRIAGTGASNNSVRGNFIGTEENGATAAGNTYPGVYIYNAPNNTVGGTTGTTPGGACTGSCNVISDNDSGGVKIEGSSASGNTVLGNFIGITVDGLSGRANSGNGVYILNASNNTVGGTTAAARNVISKNTGAGVKVEGATSSGNVVLGNYLGLPTTGVVEEDDLGNSGDGVSITSSASNNTVGGTTAGARNVISDNGSQGIEISGNSGTGNVVEGNYIGLDATGEGDCNYFNPGDLFEIGNSTDGIYLNDSPNNRIGGPAPGAGNYIGCNGDDAGEHGIDIDRDDSVGNVVQGNVIGVTVSGGEAANGEDGIRITHGHDNVIGGSAPGEGNAIANHYWWTTSSGVHIFQSDAAGNIVRGNYIRDNTEGVYMNVAPNNIIGGTGAGDGNVIILNTQGVVIYGPVTGTGNLVQGNFIGTDAAATLGLGNAGDGVFISHAVGNTIGGTTAGAGNVISGNGAAGVEIYDSDATGNVIQGNLIGTDPTGSGPLGNTADGVYINNAPSNVIGGTTASARNVISDNYSGVYITGASATGNSIQGNYIGSDATGTIDLGNSFDGVRVGGSSRNTTIGGTAAGVGNIIAFNDRNGVLIDTSDGNAILGNSIHSSQSLGIDLVTALAGFGPNWPQDYGDGEPPPGDTGQPDADTGGNNYQNFPVLSSAIAEDGSTTILGTFKSTPSTNGFRLEFFLNDSCNGSGYGDGQTRFTSTTVNTNASGDSPPISLVLPYELPDGSFVTVTATDPANNTSEFSPCQEVTGPIIDTDGDGVEDSEDNCPLVPNPGQENGDADGLGDACDNCPLDSNPGQENSDGDGHGNVCDNCSLVSNPGQEDADSDDIGDVCDNCPSTSNPGQEDDDGDAGGNACDTCPAVFNPGQITHDGQRRPNGSQVPGDWASNPAQDNPGIDCNDPGDPDDDNDALPDPSENDLTCPYRLAADSDGDYALDGYEVAMAKNACNAGDRPACLDTTDTDGDGFSDCIEHLGYNTCASVDDLTPGYTTCASPTDSDGDGCADWIEIVDVSGNRRADLGDLMLIVKRALGMIPASDSDPVFNINKDNLITMGDGLMAARNSVLLRSHSSCTPED